jgi:hypothetical protein
MFPVNMIFAPPPPDTRTELQKLAQDTQNVHTAPISQQTNRGIEELSKVTVPPDQDTMTEIRKIWTGIYKGRAVDERIYEDMNIWYSQPTCCKLNDWLYKTILDQLVAKNEMVKKLKLTSIINTTNMHVFDENCKIRKVTTPEEIIYRFYKVRKGLYIKRKEYLIKTLNESLKLLDAKIKFIELVISEQIVVFNKKKDFIIKQIETFRLLKINETYDYLLDLKLWTLTAEKIEALIENVNF